MVLAIFKGMVDEYADPVQKVRRVISVCGRRLAYGALEMPELDVSR